MIRRPRIRRGAPALSALALALVLGLLAPVGSALGASAADGTSDDMPVGVTVPEATPTPTPTPTPKPTTPTKPVTPGKPGTGTGTAEGTGSTSGSGGSGGSGGSSGTGSAAAGGGTGAPATPAEAKEPPIPRAPSTTAERATVDRATYRPGDPITVRMDGFTPGEQVQIVLFGSGTLVANVAADDSGAVTHTFELPKDLPAGQHTVQLTGWQSKRIATSSFLIEVQPAVAAPGLQGVPPWAWWAGGVLLTLMLAGLGWWLVRTMRVPAVAA